MMSTETEIILYEPEKTKRELYELISRLHKDKVGVIGHSLGGQIAASIAGQHHERFDGKGYQNKLEGEHIHIYARCVAVADVFDALVSKRCYKKPWSPKQARDEILSQAGYQFNPQITKLFDEHFDEFLKVIEDYPDAPE